MSAEACTVCGVVHVDEDDGPHEHCAGCGEYGPTNGDDCSYCDACRCSNCGEAFGEGVAARSRVDGDLCVYCYEEGEG